MLRPGARRSTTTGGALLASAGRSTRTRRGRRHVRERTHPWVASASAGRGGDHRRRARSRNRCPAAVRSARGTSRGRWRPCRSRRRGCASRPATRWAPRPPPDVPSVHLPIDGRLELLLRHLRPAPDALALRFGVQLPVGAPTRTAVRAQAAPTAGREVFHGLAAGFLRLTVLGPLLVHGARRDLLGGVFRLAPVLEAFFDVFVLP